MHHPKHCTHFIGDIANLNNSKHHQRLNKILMFLLVFHLRKISEVVYKKSLSSIACAHWTSCMHLLKMHSQVSYSIHVYLKGFVVNNFADFPEVWIKKIYTPVIGSVRNQQHLVLHICGESKCGNEFECLKFFFFFFFFEKNMVM